MREEAARLVVTVPMTPPRQVMPNARVHWKSRRTYVGKAEATACLREAAYFAALGPLLARGEQMPLFIGRVRCQVTIAWEKRRKSCDPDNALAGLKALFDGLEDTGMFGDDRQLVHDPVQQVRDPDGAGFVRVELVPDA